MSILYHLVRLVLLMLNSVKVDIGNGLCNAEKKMQVDLSRTVKIYPTFDHGVRGLELLTKFFLKVDIQVLGYQNYLYFFDHQI